MHITRNIGFLLLAIFLIAWGHSTASGYWWPRRDPGDHRHCGWNIHPDRPLDP